MRLRTPSALSTLLPVHADRPAPLPAYAWTRATGGAVESSPCVADGTVYVASNGHYLYAVDAANGRVRWRDNVGSQNGSSPACADGNVYIGSWDTGDILAITAVTALAFTRWTPEPGI
jgi:outer membrane protein assembly factor BamB